MKPQESGQATIEYILMLCAVVTFFVIVKQGLTSSNLTNTMKTPLTKNFYYAYKYGHPQATGYDEGSPKMHPRITDPDNFRIFIDPP